MIRLMCWMLALAGVAVGQEAQKVGTVYPSEGRFTWHELQVPDVEAAMRFYTRLFGWKHVDAPTVKGDRPYAMLRQGQAIFAGVAKAGNEQAAASGGRWTSWIEVEEVDTALVRALRSGGEVSRPTLNHLIGRVVFVRDPAGAEVGLVRTHFRQPFVFRPPVVWHEARVAAPGKRDDGGVDVAAFYKAVAGWDAAAENVVESLKVEGLKVEGPKADGGEDGGAVTWVLGNTRVAETLKGGVAPGEGGWTPWFEVGNLAEIVARAVGGGARLVGEIETTADGAKRARLVDPQGAEFGVISRGLK